LRARGTEFEAVPGKRISPMINVLHVVCYPELYGTQRSMLSTVKCLNRSEFTPYVAAPDNAMFKNAVHDAGCAHFVDIPMRSASDFSSFFMIKNLIHRRNIDVVHTHLGISSFLGVSAAASAGIPSIITRHFINDQYTRIINPFKRIVSLSAYRWINNRAERIVFVSQAVKNAIICRENPNPMKCHVIPNGIAIPEPDSLHTSRESQSWNLPISKPPANQKIVACVARLSPEKNLDILLRASAICIESGIDICVIVAGNGPLHSDLVLLSKTLGIEARLHFVGFLDNVYDLLSVADVFVLPAAQEPFGISILEAMAVGLPVIASKSGGALDIVESGISGLLVPPSDPEALARAMIRVIGDQALSDSLRRGGLARAAQFDERAVARRMENLYREVLGEGINSAAAGRLGD